LNRGRNSTGHLSVIKSARTTGFYSGFKIATKRPLSQWSKYRRNFERKEKRKSIIKFECEKRCQKEDSWLCGRYPNVEKALSKY